MLLSLFGMSTAFHLQPLARLISNEFFNAIHILHFNSVYIYILIYIY